MDRYPLFAYVETYNKTNGIQKGYLHNTVYTVIFYNSTKTWDANYVHV